MKILAPSPKLMTDMQQVGGIMLADWQKAAGPEGEPSSKPTTSPVQRSKAC
ncbi:hypothetical protein [Candidatus Skiveiella danica]|uniref:hypothetical protein n=1 Tax=Candidatus Skiveiella danica TaxID=3386177 RepID=UPI0039B89309